MNWLNLQVSVVRSPEYVGCEPVQRATWLNVLAYSAEQENHGRIEGARAWKDRQWQQTCGVTLAEVNDAAPLLSWDGATLIVWAYPVEREVEVQAKREGGKRGGLLSGKSRARNSNRESNEEADQQAIREAETKLNGSTPSSTPSTEGNGKEGNGKEEAKASCSELDEPAPEPVMEFSCVGNPKVWLLTQEKLSEWEETFPDMDVEGVCRQARQWLCDNPPKRKTARGMTRFLGGWLDRAQNKGEHRRAHRSAGENRAYFESPNPDAAKPFHDVLLDDFNASLGARAEAGDEQAERFLNLINGAQ